MILHYLIEEIYRVDYYENINIETMFQLPNSLQSTFNYILHISDNDPSLLGK